MQVPKSMSLLPLQDGVMWPSEALLYLTPCSAHSVYTDKVAFWNDVYGFDFSPLMLVLLSWIAVVTSLIQAPLTLLWVLISWSWKLLKSRIWDKNICPVQCLKITLEWNLRQKYLSLAVFDLRVLTLKYIYPTYVSVRMDDNSSLFSLPPSLLQSSVTVGDSGSSTAQSHPLWRRLSVTPGYCCLVTAKNYQPWRYWGKTTASLLILSGMSVWPISLLGRRSSQVSSSQ